MYTVKSFFKNFRDILEAYGWFLLTSLPVITLGATIPSLLYVLMQIHREKLNGSVKENFFKAFKNTILQGTIILVIYAVFGALLYFAITTQLADDGSKALLYLTWGVGVIYAVSLSFIFGVQARFTNTLANTIIYSLVMPIKNLIRAVLVIVITGGSVYLCITVRFVWAIYVAIAGIVIMYLFASWYNHCFAYYLPEEFQTEREKEILKKDKAYQMLIKQREIEAKIAADREREEKEKEEAEARRAEQMENEDEEATDIEAAAQEESETGESKYAPGQVISAYRYGYVPNRKHSMAEIISSTSNEAEDDTLEDEDENADE